MIDSFTSSARILIVGMTDFIGQHLAQSVMNLYCD